MASYFNYINGEWVKSKSKKTFKSTNPANTSKTVGTVQLSSKEDVNAAVKAAKHAFNPWRLTPAPVRAHYLIKAAQLLEKRKKRLGELVTSEMGKVIAEGLGDVQEAIDMAYYMAGEGRRMFGQTTHSELPNKDMKSIREPIGVFGIITPWNFPIAIPSWKILPALITGNTVVFKPSSETPICAIEFVKALDEAGLPKGVLNLVTGSGSEVGDPLIKHPDVTGVSFTGSCGVGFAIEALCGGLHKPVATEMGGKNGILVMDDADLKLAVHGAIWGGFGTTGQRCTAASRVILHKSIADDFTELFLKSTKALKIGDGLLKGTDMGPLVNEAARKKVEEYVGIGMKEGATLLTGGKVCKAREYAKGWFFEPTIFADTTPKMRIAQEEIFGPVVCLLECKDLEEGIHLINNTKFGLSNSIYTAGVNNSAIAERDIQSGLVYINASTIGSEVHLPFGGFKNTGLGHKEAGGIGGAIDVYTRVKVVYRDFSGTLQRAQLDTEELAKDVE